MKHTRWFVAVFTAGAVLAACNHAPSPNSNTIRIGDINSLTADPVYADHYKRGVQMAVEEINADGGVLGRPLEVVWRDDQMDPAVAGRAAQDLVLREQAVLLTGTYASHTALAVANQAEHLRVPFFSIWGCSPSLIWSRGNRYTFLIAPNYDTEAAMMAEQAAKFPAKRWAAIAYNFEDGETALRAFQKHLAKLRPDVEWVAEQRPAYDKLDAGATINAVQFHKPDALFTLLASTDLAKFVREGNTRRFFEGKSVAAMWAGAPDSFNPIKKDIPAGWWVTGYPVEQIREPAAHAEWIARYRARYGTYPYGGSAAGYVSYHLMAQILNKACSTDPEKIITATEGFTGQSIVGPIHARAADHQFTFGTWTARTARSAPGADATLEECVYHSGADYLPSEADAAKLRPEFKSVE